MAEDQNERFPISTEALIPLAVLSCFLAMFAIGLFAQNKPSARASGANPALQKDAKAAFESVCASCHGLDGRGGERGPDIVSRPEIIGKTDAQLVKVLADGKTAEGMPAFASYGPARLAALVTYLRGLQGGSKQPPLPGDPERGKALFFGKAKCADCHMVRGRGGFFSQDLSAYAARLGADEVRDAIVNPSKDLDPRRGLVTVTLADSTTISGVTRNEDNFSLQLQTSDGMFHLLNKTDIRSQSYAGRSAMPSDYGSTLSPAELNDLVSYLLHSAGARGMRKQESNPEEVDEE